MLYDRKYYAVLTKDDFNANIFPTLKPYYVSSLPLAVNQWTYDDTTMSAQINVDNTMQGYVLENLGFLRVGDIINVSMEVYNISGTMAKIAVDNSSTNNLNEYTNAGHVSSQKTNEWEKVTMKFVVRENKYHRVTAGIWTSDVGEFKIRNIRIEVLSQEQQKSTDIRTATIRKNAGNWEVRTDFYYDNCTISQYSSTELEVTFTSPLHPSLRAGAIVSQEYYAISNNYIARCSYSFNNKARISFYPTDNLTTPAQLNTLPNETHFTILLIAKY